MIKVFHQQLWLLKVNLLFSRMLHWSEYISHSIFLPIFTICHPLQTLDMVIIELVVIDVGLLLKCSTAQWMV